MPTQCPKCNSIDVEHDSPYPVQTRSGDDKECCDAMCNKCQYEWVEYWGITGWYDPQDPDVTYLPNERPAAFERRLHASGKMNEDEQTTTTIPR